MNDEIERVRRAELSLHSAEIATSQAELAVIRAQIAVKNAKLRQVAAYRALLEARDDEREARLAAQEDEQTANDSRNNRR